MKNPEVRLIPHTPLLLNVNALDFNYNPNAPDPQDWLKFLNDNWAQDVESQMTLQEWSGYLLTKDTRFHKILLIVGPSRSGKGTIGKILNALLGEFNVIGPTLSSLGGEFGLQPFLNKMLATISDARLNGRGNNSLIVERLLSISGEDPLTVNRKHLPALTVRLSTRIMMMSNEFPDIQDSSGAVAKRFIVLSMPKSWLGKEDTTLFSRLHKELSSILLWALRGLARLLERGKFTQPTSAIEIIEEFEDLTSPIKAFIAERCEINPRAKVLVTALFRGWKDWCREGGYFSGNRASFGKALHAAVPGMKISRPKGNGKRPRYYCGIRLL